MKTEILDGVKIHDFTPRSTGWGWNGLNFKKVSDHKAEMMGVGKGISNGDNIVMAFGDLNILFLVEEIKYNTNPPDLFNAKLKSIGTVEF